MNIFIRYIIYFFIFFTTNYILLSKEVNIRLDTSKSYQTITGWEATSFFTSYCDDEFDILKEIILPQLIDSIGITRIRLEIKSGVEHNIDNFQKFYDDGCPQAPDTNYQKWRESRYANVNDNSDTTINWNGFHFTELDRNIENTIIHLRDLMQSRGKKLFINLCYVAFTNQIKNGSYIHDNPDEYAEFVLATYLHMKNKYGFFPDAWELLLEPDNVTQWNGKKLGLAIVKTAELLKKYGIEPHFIGPSTTNMTNAIHYFDSLNTVKGAIEYLDEISYHRYGGVSQTSLKAIADRAEKFKKNTSMLEWWFDNSTYQILHEDLQIGNNSAFQQSSIAGYFDIDRTIKGSPKLTIKKISHYNRIYYHYIKPGAIRKEAISDDTLVSPLLFIEVGGNYTLIIKSGINTVVSIVGLPGGIYGITNTSETENFKINNDIRVETNKNVTVTVKKGITAIYFKENLTDINKSLENNFYKLKIDNNNSIIIISKPKKNNSFQKNDIIEIFNLLGKKIIPNFEIFQNNNIKIDISNLTSGTYIIRINNFTKIFIKN